MQFSYDPEADLLYRQYREQYQKLGRQAMEDTVGQAAGLTGGYDSSYGETAGQQAYNAYLGKLNELLPELYEAKRTEYDEETDAIYRGLSLEQQQRENAFDRCMELLGNGIRPSDEELSADYIIPKAFDPRVGPTVAAAVAEAARKTGVCR